jgi:hypothetical protein
MPKDQVEFFIQKKVNLIIYFLAPEDVCEELKDGQWPDPTDCKSYFLCRGVGSQWGEQKREACYAGKIKINFSNDS